LLIKSVGLLTCDVGGDEAFDSAYDDGWSPQEAVDYVAEKYDLKTNILGLDQAQLGINYE